MTSSLWKGVGEGGVAGAITGLKDPTAARSETHQEKPLYLCQPQELLHTIHRVLPTFISDFDICFDGSMVSALELSNTLYTDDARTRGSKASLSYILSPSTGKGSQVNEQKVCRVTPNPPTVNPTLPSGIESASAAVALVEVAPPHQKPNTGEPYSTNSAIETADSCHLLSSHTSFQLQLPHTPSHLHSSAHLPTARNVQGKKTHGKAWSKLTKEQKDYLEEKFEVDSKPSIIFRGNFAHHLSLPISTVSVSMQRTDTLHLLMLLQNWFENRRRRGKRSKTSLRNPTTINQCNGQRPQFDHCMESGQEYGGSDKTDRRIDRDASNIDIPSSDLGTTKGPNGLNQVREANVGVNEARFVLSKNWPEILSD